MDNLYIIASELNGVDTNKIEGLLNSLEAKASKSILNKENAIQKVEEALQLLKMASDKYADAPNEDLAEEIQRLALEIQIVCELFKEGSLHPDEDSHRRYTGVLEQFIGEI